MSFNPETDIQVPPVQDPEVRRFLENLTIKKPFGGKLFAYTRQLLEIVAKDVELHAYHGLPDYGIDAAKVAMLCSALPMQGLDLRRLAERALRDFSQPRFENARTRFTASAPAPRP